MKRTVFAIHFIASFVVFAFTEGWPFGLAKTVTHETPALAGSLSVPNLKGKPIFSTYLPKPAQRRGEPDFGRTKPILAAIKIGNEFGLLNTDNRLMV